MTWNPSSSGYRWHGGRQRRLAQRRNGFHPLTMPAAMLAVGMAGTIYAFGGVPFDGLAAALPGSGCTIKGNISIISGERIYHVPGQDYYVQTRIAPEWGERWFCSEAEAQRDGWRKSKR